MRASFVGGVAVLGAVLVGCAVQPSERAAETEESITIGPGATLSLAPDSICASTSAIASTPFPSSVWWQQGGSSAADLCDYFVAEVTGAIGKSMKLWVRDSSLPLITTSDLCAQSFISFESYGYVPGRYVLTTTGGVVYVPGEWKPIATKTQSGKVFGQYGTTSYVTCGFPSFLQDFPAGANGTAELDGSPYATIRVAAKVVHQTIYGESRGTAEVTVQPL